MISRVEVEQYLQDGGQLYRSGNNVILTAGLNNSGIVPPEYLSFCDANLRELISKQSQTTSNQSQPWSGRSKRW